MTRTTGTPARKKDYDFLDKKGTVRTRHDYIETGYVDGVKDAKGHQVMRPLSADERAWLSQFIEETEHGNLNKTKTIKAILKERKVIRSAWAAAKRAGNVDEILKLELQFKEKTTQIERLRDDCNNFYTKQTDVQELFNRDYERRSDVYNRAKISDNLVLYDISEYDKFTTESISHINPEMLILEHLDFVPQKKKKK